MSLQQDPSPPSAFSHHPNPCFRMENPDGSHTYLRVCEVPPRTSHSDRACLPRHIRSCSRVDNPDNSYTYVRECDDFVVEEDKTPTRNDYITLDSLRDGFQSGEKGKGKFLIFSPPQSQSSHSSPNFLNLPTQAQKESHLLREIDTQNERINALEADLAKLVKPTAFCLCSCHESIPGRPLTPRNENFEQRDQDRAQDEDRIIPDMRNDRDESCEPGLCTPVMTQSVGNGEGFGWERSVESD